MSQLALPGQSEPITWPLPGEFSAALSEDVFATVDQLVASNNLKGYGNELTQMLVNQGCPSSYAKSIATAWRLRKINRDKRAQGLTEDYGDTIIEGVLANSSIDEA